MYFRSKEKKCERDQESNEYKKNNTHTQQNKTKQMTPVIT